MPLMDKVPFGDWKTTTLIAALRADGVKAPRVVDGPIDGGLLTPLSRENV